VLCVRLRSWIESGYCYRLLRSLRGDALGDDRLLETHHDPHAGQTHTRNASLPGMREEEFPSNNVGHFFSALAQSLQYTVTLTQRMRCLLTPHLVGRKVAASVYVLT